MLVFNGYLLCLIPSFIIILIYLFYQSNQSETIRELETLRKRFGDQGNLLRSLEEQLDKIEKERIQYVRMYVCM